MIAHMTMNNFITLVIEQTVKDKHLEPIILVLVKKLICAFAQAENENAA